MKNEDELEMACKEGGLKAELHSINVKFNYMKPLVFHLKGASQQDIQSSYRWTLEKLLALDIQAVQNELGIQAYECTVA